MGSGKKPGSFVLAQFEAPLHGISGPLVALYKETHNGAERCGTKRTKNKQPYFSGTLDLGVLKEAQIMIYLS